MLKEHVHDLFTEGLGDIFFMKYYKYLLNIKNVFLRKSLITIYVIIYLAFLLIVGYIIFILSFPL